MAERLPNDNRDKATVSASEHPGCSPAAGFDKYHICMVLGPP